MCAAGWAPFRKFALPRMVGMVLACCATTAITSPAQTLTTLVSFDGADGDAPRANLVQGTDGNFYGTTAQGGASNNCTAGCGTVFKMTPSGTLTSLYSFCSQSNCTDGVNPYAGLMQATDGNFYGTTANGGAQGAGTVFKITPSGTLTTLYSFCSQLANCADGAAPFAALVQSTDGNLYGTTSAGGLFNNAGTVFKITPSGTLTTLYSFCSLGGCIDGQTPVAGLVQATDGNFYGTTSAGGGNNNCSPPFYGCGAVFKITPTGALTPLHFFCLQVGCPDGSNPQAGLVQATDGNLYGTTLHGGTNGDGAVFKITPSGALTTLYSFCSQSNCTDGLNPYAGLMQATDGNFYGTAASGGTNNSGTIFKITTDGALTTLYNFCPQQPCADGFFPLAALLQAGNGTFYGTTNEGGTGQDGTVFSLSGPTPSAAQLVPITPCRLVDTRSGSPIQGGTWQTFLVPQLGNCNISPTATAYSLNITVVPRRTLNYLTIWPAERPMPFVSTMNSPDGRIKANAAIVPAGASGAVSVYVTDTTDVILDIDGYFTAPSSQTLQFYPLTPCRVIDTRGANGDLGGPYLMAKVERDFPVLESSCLSGVQGAEAYSMNLTVVPHPAGQPLGYLTVWPQGQTQPVVSTLNNPTATAVANAAIVPAGTNGGIAVYPYNSTDLIVDINGYFAAPGTGGYSFYPVAPCRAFDSRNNNGQPFTGQITVPISGSPCAPPSNAAGYVFNATVVPSPTLGYLTLWADSGTQPGVSTLNAYDGLITSNMAIVPNTDGSTDSYAGQGYTQLIVDISGFFAP